MKGDYHHYEKVEKSVVKKDVDKKNLTGKFVVEKTETGIRIKEVLLFDGGVEFPTYFKSVIAMKKM